MKLKFLVSTTFLATIGLLTPAWAEPMRGSASDLLLPEEESTENFEYETDQLDRLSTQINDRVDVEVTNERDVRGIRPTQDVNSSDRLVIIDSDEDFPTDSETPLR